MKERSGVDGETRVAHPMACAPWLLHGVMGLCGDDRPSVRGRCMGLTETGSVGGMGLTMVRPSCCTLHRGCVLPMSSTEGLGQTSGMIMMKDG